MVSTAVPGDQTGDLWIKLRCAWDIRLQGYLVPRESSTATMEGNAARNSTSVGPGLLESGYGSGENAPREYSADYMKNLKRYSSVKTVAQSFLDVALLMANASQLKSVMDSGTEFKYFKLLLGMLALSISLQILVGLFLICIVILDTQETCRTTWRWNFSDL
ncbi:uncharacterized protein LOC133349540 isoform X2 [Lethenteron reissneri]|uniref:uncharacterized protein LOC133349540 isoform X2 n=1 Tax=Lethenteron reissneri TaxID=7753 RepID=UPI002AB71817|nr:uncharacterized protein LOC133349540 isoform X2 [Lethenteron reissneri]